MIELLKQNLIHGFDFECHTTQKLIFDSISFNKGNYLFLYIFMAIFSCDHTYVKLYDIS